MALFATALAIPGGSMASGGFVVLFAIAVDVTSVSWS